ncbi:MAG: Integrase core domain protein [Syntrophus sp. PtaU1.Bin208]|nr:MAG: Integrase core domain protein [Syntrophus sp. PtaU1.Bin208]
MISAEVFMTIVAMNKIQGFSIRKIAQITGKHRNTVKRYLEGNKFPRYRRQTKESKLDPYRQAIDDFLSEDAYQATWIYDRLKRMGYPGAYESVKVYVRGVKEQKKRLAYLRFETEPGLQAQFDWGDFQITEADGRVTTVYAFVMLLGYSRAMYVEFVKRCTMETFMDCHAQAFRYLGGIPSEILYDNMKNVVLRKSGGKPVFNLEFLHFAHHYGFQPTLCPPYSPWVKGKVERPIQFLRERFWRGYSFTTLERTNADVLRWLDETAHQRVHGTHGQPVRVRWEEEIPHLGRLPATDYDTSLKVFRKVYKDCRLSWEGNRYQVPHHVVGKRVMLKIKARRIRIYHDQDLLVTYQQPETKGKSLGYPWLDAALRYDKEQLKRKTYTGKKGKATRGLMTGSLYPQVAHRPLSEYEPYAAGGVLWNS